MSFGLLALVCVAGLAGPLLAVSRRFGVPVVVGELVAGVALGPMMVGAVHADEPTLTFMATIGFALVMFVAGSHVPMRDLRLRQALPVGLLNAAVVGVASAPVALGLAAVFGTGHALLYAVLLSSSSAALILPIVQSLHLTDGPALSLLPQVAIADAACIVALPLAIDPVRAGRAALGATVVLACAIVLWAALRASERRGWRASVHHLSERGKFALELRVSLVALFGLAAIAQAGGVSVMLAGFASGMAVAAVGEPRRLARQLFGVTEGFFGPLFFVWLGASLDLHALVQRPALIGLGTALGVGAAITHVAARATGQPLALGMLASAQLGVPVAAATLGGASHLLVDGEPAALLLGALVTIVIAAVAARLLGPRPGDEPAVSATAHPGS
ncbi:MAG: cation:proton antiporter [Cellulomonas sp.]|nr:cation:proton antiporter [Cellulomonas sp.]